MADETLKVFKVDIGFTDGELDSLHAAVLKIAEREGFVTAEDFKGLYKNPFKVGDTDTKATPRELAPIDINVAWLYKEENPPFRFGGDIEGLCLEFTVSYDQGIWTVHSVGVA